MLHVKVILHGVVITGRLSEIGFRPKERSRGFRIPTASTPDKAPHKPLTKLMGARSIYIIPEYELFYPFLFFVYLLFHDIYNFDMHRYSPRRVNMHTTTGLQLIPDIVWGQRPGPKIYYSRGK